MKKFLTAMSVLVGLGLATAQQVAPATAHKTTTKVRKVDAKKNVAKKEAKQAETKKVAPPKTNGVKLKADGTPDKRYKNAKHLKKDGTPDKRYKANK